MGHLPTTEPRREEDDVLHHKYLVSLLPKNRLHDRPYYRGDAYEHNVTTNSSRWEQWERETEGEYLNRIRRSTRTFAELKNLRDWMEVSTSVTRHAYLSEHPREREERTHRVQVTRVDFVQGNAPKKLEFKDERSLSESLQRDETTSSYPDARVYVVEDLSRDVIELFGSAFNIDPHFFRSHVNDYLWNTVASENVERRDLDIMSRKRSHFTLQYLRPRYYRDTESYKAAVRQASAFNVLRHLDSDRSREHLMDDNGAAVVLMRAKLSVWTRPVSPADKRLTVIVLVDPTPSAGYPLWGGYTSFSNWEPNWNLSTLPQPPRTSLYEDLVYWMCQMGDTEVEKMSDDPRLCAVPALWLVLSDWHHIVQYMTAQITRIEWAIELPDWGKSSKSVDDRVLSRLHPWRRNISLYRAMITDAMHRLYPHQLQKQPNDENTLDGLQALYSDFKIILDDIDSIQAHIAQLVSVATAFQSLDESRRALDQNHNVARLTYLATLFIPLSFVSGFLSMEPDITKLRRTFWIFFAIALPLTAAAVVTADFLHLQKKLKGFFKRETLR